MHHAVPANRNLKPNFCAQVIQDGDLALRLQEQSTRHAQADSEDGATLQRSQSLATSRGGVDTGEFGQGLLAGVYDARVDERVGRKYRASFARRALERQVGERCIRRVWGDGAVEVFAARGLDSDNDKITDGGEILVAWSARHT